MSKQKTALITGITGQDGAYLAALLLDEGYAVHGVVRWDSHIDYSRLDYLNVRDHITLHQGDLIDTANVMALIEAVQPDEVYNLGALSHVGTSFKTPLSTMQINLNGAISVFEAVRLYQSRKPIKVYQASSSEMFGNAPPPQNEDTPMHPRSPYAIAKQAAYNMARLYREAYGLFIVNGILFNHESPLRGDDFVTQKIARAAAARQNRQGAPVLCLGNLDSRRDWGHARDYVRGMWMMLQADKPDDFVLATGSMHTVRSCVETAFQYVGIDIEWQGEGPDETGMCRQTADVLVRIDPALFRPAEVDALCGDASKARDVLGWKPEIGFEALMQDMVDAARRRIIAQSAEYAA